MLATSVLGHVVPARSPPADRDAAASPEPPPSLKVAAEPVDGQPARWLQVYVVDPVVRAREYVTLGCGVLPDDISSTAFPCRSGVLYSSCSASMTSVGTLTPSAQASVE
jgi:hypothetical protein